jgi:hypothetical protein
MKSKKPIKKICLYCNAEFETYYGQKIFCSRACNDRYHQKVRQPTEKRRHCKICGKEFKVQPKQGNKQHCSEECARESARNSRKKFHEKNPRSYLKYNKNRINTHGQDSLINRFFKKYPHIERKCIVCGEQRVLDLHHVKKRNGAWRLMSNTTPDNIQVLCPTCHALIEREICTPHELGI